MKKDKRQAKVRFQGVLLVLAALLLAMCALMAGCSGMSTTQEAKEKQEAASMEESPGEAQGEQEASGEETATGAEAETETGTGTGTPSDAVDSQGSAGGASGPAEDADEPVPEEEERASISVQLRVDASEAATYGYASSLFSGTVQLAEGATVYDALCATGLSISGSGGYVKGIGGLAEKSCDHATSGWVYTVNGSQVQKAANRCELHAGDAVVWYFTLSGTLE